MSRRSPGMPTSRAHRASWERETSKLRKATRPETGSTRKRPRKSPPRSRSRPRFKASVVFPDFRCAGISSRPAGREQVLDAPAHRLVGNVGEQRRIKGAPHGALGGDAALRLGRTRTVKAASATAPSKCWRSCSAASSAALSSTSARVTAVIGRAPHCRARRRSSRRSASRRIRAASGSGSGGTSRASAHARASSTAIVAPWRRSSRPVTRSKVSCRWPSGTGPRSSVTHSSAGRA